MQNLVIEQKQKLHLSDTMTKGKKKYRINELLEGLSVRDNKRALAILPAELGISPNTFKNFRNIGIADSQDIPHTIVVKLEQFFSLKPGQLQNYTTEVRPIKDRRDDDDHLAGKLGLTNL